MLRWTSRLRAAIRALMPTTRRYRSVAMKTFELADAWKLGRSTEASA